MGVVADLLTVTLDAVFPRFCVSCRAEGAVLCRACATGWKTRVGTSEKGVALGSYEDLILDKLIHLWKYGFDEKAREVLFARIDREILRIQAYVADEEGIVFVPLHRKRFCERGFDQAEDLARHLANRLHLPFYPVIMRTRATVRQALLSEEERKNQMRANPFVIRGDIVGKRLLLVDDVITTGATTDAVLEILIQSGAKSVKKFALAMT